MIAPADRPFEAACAALRALYVGLNSPVVRASPLPVGPASAAVALHEREPGVTVMVRSVRTGQVAFFTSDREQPRAPDVLLDAALAFAEGLGFVFDGDEVGVDGAGAQDAARLWCELIGEEYRAAPAADVLPQGPQVLAERDAPSGREVAIPDLLIDASAPGWAAGVEAVLSKFRWSLPAPPGDRSST